MNVQNHFDATYALLTPVVQPSNNNTYTILPYSDPQCVDNLQAEIVRLNDEVSLSNGNFICFLFLIMFFSVLVK